MQQQLVFEGWTFYRKRDQSLIGGVRKPLTLKDIGVYLDWLEQQDTQQTLEQGGPGQ